MGLAIIGVIVFMTMDQSGDMNDAESLKATLYVDDAIETVMLIIMLFAALWVSKLKEKLQV